MTQRWSEYESYLGQGYSYLYFVDTRGNSSLNNNSSPRATPEDAQTIYEIATDVTRLDAELSFPETAVDYIPLPDVVEDGTMADLLQEHHRTPSSSSEENAPVTIEEHAGGAVPETVVLSPEQHQVLEMVKNGRNIFFTGAAGTGKSVLLREIINHFREMDYIATGKLAVTASTGIAGLNISGVTVHSFTGIGLGKESQDDLALRIMGSSRLYERWTKLEILIIDEISMLDGLLFDKLEYIARTVRGNNVPFGGVQLVLSGDFFQLPPVPDNGQTATYTFDAKSWHRCVGAPVVLRRVFRQVDDNFIAMLSEMRMGRLSGKHIEMWCRLERPLTYPDGIEPSQLFPLRAQVEGYNNKRLNDLSGSAHEFLSMDYRGFDHMRKQVPLQKAKQLLEREVAPKAITLKVGAQVMLLRNVVQGVLVNGSVGQVVEFLTTRDACERNVQIAKVEQQAPRINSGYKNAERPDPHERLDRDKARRLPEPFLEPEEIPLEPMDNNQFTKYQRWPLVRFTNGDELLCSPLPFNVEGILSNVEARRLQVPLILAWALSIHKSQGQTLTRVKVDLGRIFEKGQAYVALSRATTLECLEVVNFHPDRILAHPRVLAWHRSWMEDENLEPTTI